MYNGKYLIVVALLLVCLFCQQAVEANFLHKVGHEVHKAADKVDKVVKHVDHAKTVIAAGSAVAGIIAGAATA